MFQQLGSGQILGGLEVGVELELLVGLEGREQGAVSQPDDPEELVAAGEVVVGQARQRARWPRPGRSC